MLLRRLTIFCVGILLFACKNDSSNAYYIKARVMESKGLYEEAIALLDKALEEEPDNIEILLDRGVDKSMIGNYPGAVEDYSRVIELHPGNSLAYFNRGNNKKRMGDYIGALEDYNRIVFPPRDENIYLELVYSEDNEDHNPFEVNLTELCYERGIAYYYADSIKKALRDFNFCISKKYMEADMYYWRGAVYITQGMTNWACIDLYKSKALGDLNAYELIDQYCQ